MNRAAVTRPGHLLFPMLLALAFAALWASCGGGRRMPPPPGQIAVDRDAGRDVAKDTTGVADTALPGTRPMVGSCTGPADANKALGQACGCHEECGSGKCVDGVCCNTACTGTCQACNIGGRAGTCSPLADGAPPVVPGQCVAQPAQSCGLDGLCNGHGSCRLHPDGTVCQDGRCDGSQVVAGKACDGGKCKDSGTVSCAPFGCDASAKRCHARCTSDAECAGAKCEGGSCGKKPLGASCSGADECEAGICTDGVCCNIDCNGPCVSCREVGQLGRCTPVGVGRPDPHGLCKTEELESCGQTGLCNGQGGCATVAPGTVCKASSCNGATFNPASVCDEDGACLPGTATTCAPFLCTEGVCRGSCSGNDQCVNPAVCVNGSCGPKATGQPCKAANECSSNFCVDGVCCESACNGQCSSCALPNAPGRCTPVPSGAPDPRAAAGVVDPARICVDEGKSTCGTNGRCNGKGGCQRYEEGSVCQNEACDGAANRSSIGTCAGGTCRITTRGCTPNLCNGNRCGIRCDTNAQCAAPNVCQNGSCGKRPDGEPCSEKSPAECASGFCAQGVCCSSACTGSCVSCALPRSAGTCAAVPDGTVDPAKVCVDRKPFACATDGKCNGKGGCRSYAPGTLCAAAACQTGKATKAAFCTTAGTCPAAEIEVCTPIIVCNAAGNACERTCTRDSQCVAGTKCFAGKCGLLEDGKTCDENNDCTSGFCADGVCCNSACGGNSKNDCQACSAKEGASKDGVCTLRTGRTCSDENACTKVDVCVVSSTAPGAVCQGTMPVVCTARSQCHSIGVCDPRTGTCSQPTLRDTTPCDDGSMCTLGDACTAGVCRGTRKTCGPAGTCQTAGCNEATGVCNPPKLDGTSCNDNDRCTTGQDVCKAGVCTGTPKLCPATDSCHGVGVCEPATGLCSNPVKPDESPCEDNSKCTTGDQCMAGKCMPGTQTVTCPSCRTCDATTGACTNTAGNGTKCDDSNVCTIFDDCRSGVCKGLAIPGCGLSDPGVPLP